MAYEIFKRTNARVENPTLAITPDARIAINAAAVRILLEAGVRSVLLLWDSQNGKLALKAAPKGDKNAYALSISDKHSGSLRPKSFLTHVGWQAERRETFNANWNEKEKMLEIILPMGRLKSRSTKE